MRIILSFFCLMLFISSDCKAQSGVTHSDLYENYERYKEPAIKNRRFKHSDIVALVRQLRTPFHVAEAGRSIEGREIYKVSIGEGPVKVLLWSQMHGDEPTATMAIMDIFNFFKKSDEFNPFRERLLDELTLVFIPMLNPDGAEDFQRRNTLGIDLNRDALRLQCPESQILKRIRDELDADWGFNLHDQNRYTGAGRRPHTATVSFLAPAFNYEKDIDESRGDAMRLIGHMNDVLQEYIPEKIGKYNDDFEPRAFGDNIQKWGTRTILIESGGLEDDPEKQYIRKLNFVALLSAFDAIAGGSYAEEPLSTYQGIPFNDSNQFFDLLVREVQVERNGQWYTVDIGFRRSEIDVSDHRSFYYRSRISDLGDLSIFYGYEEFVAKGYKAVPGKVYRQVLSNPEQLKKMDVAGLLRQGYTEVLLRELPPQSAIDQFPLVLSEPGKRVANYILPGSNPSLILKKDGVIRFAIVNGFIFDLEKDADRIRQMIQRI